MKTLDEVLGTIQRHIERSVLEDYIAREWVRPHRKEEIWYFEEIDIARLELICHLTQDIEINDQGMDITLSLLDQLYEMRVRMKHITHAITQQPPQVQSKIMNIIKQLTEPDALS